MNTLRALILTGIFALSVFLVGLSLGLQLAGGHTRRPSAPPSPDYPATVAALEEQLRAVEATVQSASSLTPSGSQSSAPAAVSPTPTLRVVTRATLTAQPKSEEETAAMIAQAYLGGGEVVEVKREKKYGTDVFEVKFKHGSEVYVDVQNRRILYAEIKPDDLSTSPTPTLLPTVPPTSTPIPAPPPTFTPAPPSEEDTKGEEQEAPEEQKPEDQDTHEHEEDQDSKDEDKGEGDNQKQDKESHDKESEKNDEHEEKD